MQGGVVVAGLSIAIGLVASVASSYLLADRTVMKTIATSNPTSFQPKGLKGKDIAHDAVSVYAVMWIVLYSLCGVSAMFLMVQGVAGELYHPENVQTSGVLTGSAFLVTSAFNPTMSTSYRGGVNDNLWLFNLAYVQTGTAALLTIVGVAVGETFSRGPTFALFVGIPVGLLGGWLVVATVIGVVLERAVVNSGGKNQQVVRPKPGYAPLTAAAVSGVAAISAGNPALVVPSAIVCLLLVPDIKHFYALGLALFAWVLSSIPVIM